VILAKDEDGRHRCYRRAWAVPQLRGAVAQRRQLQRFCYLQRDLAAGSESVPTSDNESCGCGNEAIAPGRPVTTEGISHPTGQTIKGAAQLAVVGQRGDELRDSQHREG